MSLSLDLDNLWSYLKTHASPGWETFPSYLDEAVDIILERLAAHRLRITFFIVGQDAALQKNRASLRAIADAGHEIANHSFCHEPWLHLWPRERLDREIQDAEDAIRSATGLTTRGFRGPGFSLSADTLAVLAARGYLYDASTLPTYLGPLARLYLLRTSRNLSPEQRKQRARLFGTLAEGRRSIRPYRWEVDGRSILEIPVTTLPVLKTPVHQNYLLFLAGISPALSLAYLKTTIALFRAFKVQPSFLLHPLDFLGGDRVRQLAFFPGMQLSTSVKLRLFDHTIARLRQYFEPVTMEQHAQYALAEPGAAATPAKAYAD